MLESSKEEPSSTSTTPDSAQPSETASTEAVEELKKEFAQYNQHNVPRDKKEAEKRIPRRAKTPSKKDYQRSRGRNKR